MGKSNYNELKQDERLMELVEFIGAESQKARDKLAKKGSERIMEINEFEKKFSEEITVPVGYDRNEFHYAQGVEAGWEKGILETQKTTVFNMLSEKCEVDFISKITGLSKKEIMSLEKEGKNLEMKAA